MTRKTVLITGCSDGGIGQSLAEEYLARGCLVIATSRKTSSMSVLANRPNCHLVQLDVTDQSSIDAARSKVEQIVGGKLDILFNNAGISYTTAAIDMNVDTCIDVFEANVFGVMRVTKAFARMVVSAKGVIAATGSVAGTFPNPFGGVYHTSKAALHAYLDCLRLEMEPFDVHVVNVVTGAIQSNIAANAAARVDMPKDSLYKPAEQDLLKRMKTSQHAGNTPRPEYVRDVVAKTLKSNPPARIYKGTHAGTAWFLQAFVPFWLTAYLMASRFGMHKLYKLLHRN